MKRLLYLLIASCLGLNAFAEVRTWTDLRGRKVEAELTGVETGRGGTQVVLKSTNGATSKFPFSQLSEADQEYVRQQMPFDPRRAAAQIDRLVTEKLAEANQEIRTEQSIVATDREMNREDRLKRLDELAQLEEMSRPTDRTTDEQFVRRIYLDIAGRIPTYEETVAFLENNDREKRYKLIDQLIESEAFVSHFFNYTSDLLRIRSHVTPNGVDGLQGRAYMDWMKDQIRSRRGWDQIVTDLVTAQGTLWENPAVGYFYTDYNMLLCNVSNTFTVFMGTEITCAQCHDHPFEEVYQMDFFRAAAFFGNLEYRSDSKKLAAIQAEESRLQGEMKSLGATGGGGKMQKDDMLTKLAGAYRYSLHDGEVNRTRLPHDYKYDDAQPNDPVRPATYFGELVELEKYDTSREAFAAWMTSEENPRFAVNLANRLWKHAFGLAQIEPVGNLPGHLDDHAQNYALLTYLETLIRDLDFNIQNFLRVLYYTETYQREACHNSPTMAQVAKGQYHFPAPVLRRMTAEQLWDSMVTLTTSDPDAFESRVLEKYRVLMDRDWSQMNGQDAVKFKEEFRSLGREVEAMEAGELDIPGQTVINGEAMVRASELTVPAPPGHFLEMFGQSDKNLVENSTQIGSVPQVLMLMNGSLTNQTLTADTSKIMQDALKIRGRGDTVDAIFLSILNREPTADERVRAQSAIRTTRRDEESKKLSNYGNLIWALLNTREFMFIQ